MQLSDESVMPAASDFHPVLTAAHCRCLEAAVGADVFAEYVQAKVAEGTVEVLFPDFSRLDPNTAVLRVLNYLIE